MKKRLCFIASLIVCLFGANAHAQLRKASDYFPLEAGNKWWTIGIKGLDYGLDSIQVTGATTINDTTYFIMESDSTEFFRKDAVGNVYKRIDGIDQLFYKVTADKNERWNLRAGGRAYHMVLTDGAGEIRTALGTLQNSKYFQLQPVGIDSNLSALHVLAPGLGQVAHSTETGLDPMLRWERRRAIINNVLFGGPFQMLGHNPGRNQREVEVNSNIRFRFRTGVDTSLVLNKVKVFSNKRGELPGQVHSDGRPFWFFTFHPAEWFQPFDTITVRISAELQDVFGEGLDGNGNWQYEGSPADDYSWRFFTDEGYAPFAREVWSEPMQIQSLGVLEHIEGQPSIAPYGDKLFLFKTNSIVVSALQDGIWNTPTTLNDRINAGIDEAPSISPDEKRLYFRRYSGGYGGWDLWVSEWADSLNDWGAAENLGPNINTEADEWFCFTPDNRQLYFGRFGGTLWVSQWNETLQAWGVSQSFENSRLNGTFINGLTMPANRKKIYLGQFIETGKHVEFELLVSYFDSTTGRYGDPFRLNINSPPPDSQPHYNPGNLGYDAYPSVTADGKYLYFESDRGPDWNGNNFHDIYVSRLLIDENGNPVSVKDKPIISPFNFELHQNFPNPFNPETTITFRIAQSSEVILGIYDVLGRQARELLAQRLTSGLHSVLWNGRDNQGQLLPSGVYFCRLRAENHIQSRKMLFVR